MREKNNITPPNHATPTDHWRAMTARYLGMTVGGGVLSAPLRNALFALFIAGILAYGAAFAWYMLDRFDLLNLIRDVNNDDAFYYFQIAYHLAEGKFSTFDGGITRTNGYHPIWLFLITPFYWVFDKETALFAIKAFEIMLVAGGVALITAAARLARLPWYLLFAALPMLYQYHHIFAGLEAAAALFMLGLFFLATMLYARSPARWKWALAAVAFALPWVRLEYIAISLATTGALAFIEWSRPDVRPAPPGAPRILSSSHLFIPILGAVAGILVYFIYNKVAFGGIVPVSGATKQAWSRSLWEQEGGYSLTKNLQETLDISVFSDKVSLVLVAYVCLPLVWWFARRSRSRQDWLLLAFLAGVFGLATGHLARFAYSVLTMHPSQVDWTEWYYVPVYLLSALTIPTVCYVAIYFTRRFIGFIGPRSHRATNILGSGIVVVAAVFLLAKADVFTSPFAFVTRSSENTVYGTGRHSLVDAFAGVHIMNRILPEDSVVGAWDAGVVGYFLRFPVVNLDGLVNDYDYFREYGEMWGGGLFKLPDFDQVMRRRFGTTYYVKDFAEKAMKRDNQIYEGAPWFFKYMKVLRIWSADRLGAETPILRAVLHDLSNDHTYAIQLRTVNVDDERQAVATPMSDLKAQSIWRVLKDAVVTGGADGLTAVGADRTEYQFRLRREDETTWSHWRTAFPVRDLDTSEWFYEHIAPHFDWQSDSIGVIVDGRMAQAFSRDCTLDKVMGWSWMERGDETVVKSASPAYRTQTGLCVAAIVLPHTALPASVRAEEMISASEWLADMISDSQPAIRSDWNVYLIDDSLIYVRERCGESDIAPMFFLHLVPVDADDLPIHRKLYGFDNLDFAFRHHDLGEGIVCVAKRELPDYDIAAIRTGQFIPGEDQIWKGSFDLAEPADDGQAAP